MNRILDQINKDIIDHPENKKFTEMSWQPIYSISENSKIILISQAPGRLAQESNIPWNDFSGNTLRKWLGVSREDFYNLDNFAILPMDFYFPGKGKTGDLAPRNNFAPLWHKRILDQLNNIKLIILIGNCSQKYYVKDSHNLTQRIERYKNYLPEYFVLPHPSPLNGRWLRKNTWFENKIVPELQELVSKIIHNYKN
jgi:uracil-DNA glycosylase